MAEIAGDSIQNWLQCTPASLGLGMVAESCQNAPDGWSQFEADASTASALVVGTDSSDPHATGRDLYTNPKYIGAAFSSIMNHVQNRANFHPADMAAKELATAFSSFVRELNETPFFRKKASQVEEQEHRSSDYNQLIDQIGNLYDDLSADDLAKVKEAITDMARSVFGSSHSKGWKNLFSQTTLDLRDPANPKFRLYYTSLFMSHDDNGKHGVDSDQKYTVQKLTYDVLPHVIQAHADELASLDMIGLDRWVLAHTSPRQDVDLCFESISIPAPRPMIK